MDVLTITMAIVFAAVFLGFFAVFFMDFLKKNKSAPVQEHFPEDAQVLIKELAAAKAALREQERLAGDKYSRDIEKLKEECELYKKESFEARLEAQNLHKDLIAQKSAYKILSLEHQSLREHQVGIEGAERQAKEEVQTQTKDFQKLREDIEEQRRRSLEECEKLRTEYEQFRKDAALAQEAVEKKYQDIGFHKVAFEKLSEEHELLRRQLLDIQELHKSDQAIIEDITRKLELANNTLAAQEEVQKDTEKLEELLEKQIAVQKKRATELFQLEQENKALKEQADVLKKELAEFKKTT